MDTGIIFPFFVQNVCVSVPEHLKLIYVILFLSYRPIEIVLCRRKLNFSRFTYYN